MANQKNLSNLRAAQESQHGEQARGRGHGLRHGERLQPAATSGPGSRHRHQPDCAALRAARCRLAPAACRSVALPTSFAPYTVVNLESGCSSTSMGLSHHRRSLWTTYKKLGLASSKKAAIKILGSGELTSALTIHAHKFSKSVRRKDSKRPAARRSLGGDAPVKARNWFPRQPR